LATAQLLLQNDIDPILQISCRDKNRPTLEIEIQGALALGVTSVLLVRGESAGISDTSDRIVKVSTTELIQMVRRVEAELQQSNLSVGTIATVFKPAADWHPAALLKKTRAGANFIRTQLCFDADKLKLYMPKLVRSKVTWKAPIIVNLAVLPSAKAAKWLSENLRGSLIPETVIKRMEHAVDPETEGVQIAAELMAEFNTIPGISGVCLMTPGPPELIPAAVNASGVRQD
jgi:methylenetetrahydrofolate reductase (NADPH)